MARLTQTIGQATNLRAEKPWDKIRGAPVRTTVTDWDDPELADHENVSHQQRVDALNDAGWTIDPTNREAVRATYERLEHRLPAARRTRSADL